MTMRKLLRFKSVRLFIFFVSLLLIADSRMVYGAENSYKYMRYEERFRKSSFSKFQNGLSQTISGLEQRSDNLEAMNQNIEGRVNMLASEKDKLNKAYAQVKVRQSNLEKEHAKLKKKATSLEVAYKKLSGKVNVAKPSTKPKSVAQKKSVPKTTQKKSSSQSRSTAKTSSGKKVSIAGKQEAKAAVQPPPPIVSEARVSEEQKGERVSGVDIRQINEKGIEYGKKGMYDQAIKEFQKVVTIDPNLANARYNLGLAYKKKGMLSDANREFAEYERLKGQNN